MIYLDNTTEIQQIYIPRAVISKDAVSKYVTENELMDALANETARTEETYQKIADMSAYTQTSGFATINGSAITEGGNLVIQGGSGETYSAGTNIDIDENNVISVTGITVPTKLSDLENDEGFITSGDIPTSNTAFTNDAGYITTADTQDFVTSADVKTQVEAYNYVDSGDVQNQINESISGKADSSAVTSQISEVKSEIESEIPSKVSDLQNDLNFASTGWVSEQGYLTEHQSLSAYSTTEQMNTAIENETSGKVDTSAMTQYYTSAQTNTAISNATSGLATEQYVDNSVSGKVDTSAMTAYWTSAETESAITSATEDFVTSAEVETQITDKGYITGYTETDPVFQASAASGITSGDINNWNDKLDASALTPYYTSGETNTAINNAVSEKADADTFTAYTPTSGFATINGSAITEGGNLVIQGGSGETYSAGANIDISAQNEISVTGITSYTGITSGDITTALGYTPISGVDLTDYYTSAQTDTQISNAISGKQDTLISGTNIKTINNESLLGSGNIVISGGSGGSANIIELTQAEYDALTAYTPDAMYVITDAQEINMDNYATTGDLGSYYTSAQTDTAISNAVSGKADASSVTANTGRQFPRWNSQGVVTGTTGNTVYERYISINGSYNSVLRPTNSDMTGIYAPTSSGVQGQPLLSNGSGAPVWGSYKFQFLTQAEYDALATKYSTTIYFIISEN